MEKTPSMTPKIDFFPSPTAGPAPVFSILIPSWNNLPYLQCCLKSIKKNSRYAHQVIVHVNEGNDGTLQWVKEQGLDHTHSHGNAGVCYGFNAPAALAKSDYLLLSDDDYYFAPDWDHYLLEEIKKLDHIYFCITGTMIEHGKVRFNTTIPDSDFGKTVETFDEKKFLEEYSKIPFTDWNGGNWYPLALHRNIWNLIGGLSIEFTPGMGSDPDMMMKLWHCGIRYYKGVSASRVYHFGSKSTHRVKRNDGNKQFLLKWGMTISTFFKYYLRLGQPFSGPTPEPDLKSFAAKWRRDRIKRLFVVWK